MVDHQHKIQARRDQKDSPTSLTLKNSFEPNSY
jgi:hypothetical protein